MYILKNAVRNVWRNRKRYVLEGVIVLILLIGISLSIIIGDTVGVIINDYAKGFQISASIEPDYMSLLQKGTYNDFSPLSVEQLEQIAQSKYIDKVHTSMDVGVYVYDITPVGSDEEGTQLPEGLNQESIYLGEDSGEEPIYKANASLLGYNDASLLTDFASGLRKIKEGNYVQNANECIISSEFADKNGIRVGDTIDMSSVRGDEFTLTVVGIYLDAKPVKQLLVYEPTANYRNDIITNCETITSNIDEGGYSTHATYILNSSESVELFKQQLKDDGILDSYALTTNKDEYEAIVKPVKNIGKTMNSFQYILMICGAVVIVILSMLSIHERKYEIGVLRSRGMKKSKLLTQFLLENVILVALCLMIGMAISTSTAQSVSNVLLEDQMKNNSSDSTEDELESNGFTNGYSFIDQSVSYGNNLEIGQLDNISVTLSMSVILKIAMISIGLALLASIASMRAIMKYEPSQILANRS